MKKRNLILIVVFIFIAGFVFGMIFSETLKPRPARAQAGGVSLTWEEMSSSIKRTLHRAAVPGGWLVAQQSGLAFVPDANHAWQ